MDIVAASLVRLGHSLGYSVSSSVFTSKPSPQAGQVRSLSAFQKQSTSDKFIRICLVLWNVSTNRLFCKKCLPFHLIRSLNTKLLEHGCRYVLKGRILCSHLPVGNRNDRNQGRIYAVVPTPLVTIIRKYPALKASQDALPEGPVPDILTHGCRRRGKSTQFQPVIKYHVWSVNKNLRPSYTDPPSSQMDKAVLFSDLHCGYFWADHFRVFFNRR